MATMLRAVVVASVVLWALPALASAEWRQVRTDHLLVIGEVDAGVLREVALRLEQFRGVLRVVHPDVVPEREAAPVVVAVFGSQGALRPFLPRAGGRVVELDGVFQPGPDVSYIALSLDAGARPYPTLLHEYTHHLLGGAFADAPVWFVEGIAEYYRTLRVEADGRRAVLGEPIAPHLARLRDRGLPLDELFAIARSSPAYRSNTTDRDLLYAQAWAVVHHAFHGEPRRGEALLALARRAAAGDDVAAMLEEVYGLDIATLEQQVRLHARRPVFPRRAVTVPGGLVTRLEATAEALPEAEADAYLGDLLARTGRIEAAETRLESAVAAAPDLPLAHAFLGALRLRQGRTDDGLAHLERAVARGTDHPTVLLQYARGVVDQAPRERDALQPAAEALARALALRPGYTEATLLLAYIRSVAREDDGVRALLEPVVRAEPGNHRAALRLSEALLRLGDVARARALLAGVLDRSSSDAERARARALLSLADAVGGS